MRTAVYLLAMVAALATVRARSVDLETVGSERHESRVAQPVVLASEVADLLAAHEPRQPRKHRANTSGKTDEGGFFKAYGSDADGEKGYLKKSFGKGEHGYKNYDTFHKKLGDRYGFQEHESFGPQKKHRSKPEKPKKKAADHVGAGTDVETHYAGGDYYDGGDGEYYEGDGGGGGEDDASTYNSGESYGEAYASSAEGGDGSAESYGESSAESSSEYY